MYKGTSEKRPSTSLSENSNPHVSANTLRSKFFCRLGSGRFSEVPKVIYSRNALEDLKKIDQNIAIRIIKKIGFFSEQKSPLYFAKPLKNFGEGRYRFRIGDYRAIFIIDKNGKMQILMILNIKHRKEVYL